ncbi:MAG: hypothetical protein AAF590_03720 [Pseudomonadota bacterium]
MSLIPLAQTRRPHLHAITAAAFLGLTLALPPTPAASQEIERPTLTIELNTVRQVDSACRLVFLTSNDLRYDLTAVAFETVLINRDGLVDRLTVFDFQDLPKDRQRVRQFDLADTDCTVLGQVLINGAVTCNSDDTQTDDCIDKLIVSTRTDVEISG